MTAALLWKMKVAKVGMVCAAEKGKGQGWS